jgi:hypothetical protein
MSNISISLLIGLFIVGCKTTDQNSSNASTTRSVTASADAGTSDPSTEEKIALKDFYSELKWGSKLLHVCKDDTEFPQYAYLDFQKSEIVNIATEPRIVTGLWGSKRVKAHFKCLEVLTTGSDPVFKSQATYPSKCDENGAQIPPTGKNWTVVQSTKNMVLIRRNNRSGWVMRSCLIAENQSPSMK